MVCKYCKTSNASNAAYCVNCGRLLNGAKAKIVLAKDEYESLKLEKSQLEGKITSLTNLDNMRLEKIQSLQNEIDNLGKEKKNAPSLNYSLILKSAGLAKLQVVKAVKESFNYGLKEAKDLVDEAPSVIVEGLSKADAEKYKKIIELAGATIELHEGIGIPYGYRLISESALEELKREEEDSVYYLVLVNAGAAKLQVVKAVKESLNIDLSKAKEYVDDAPSVIALNLSKYDSDMIAHSIEAAGGEVEIKRHNDIPSGHTVIKKSYYDFLETERDKVLKDGYAPPGYHLEENNIKEQYQAPYNIVKNLFRSKDPDVTIRKSEYESLKRRANMSLWDKIKESLGF